MNKNEYKKSKNSEFYHVLASHKDILTVHKKIAEIYKDYKDLDYNIIEKLPNSFTYRLEDGTKVLVAWDQEQEVIFEDVIKFPADFAKDCNPK